MQCPNSTIHRHAGNKHPTLVAERPLLMGVTELAPEITGPLPETMYSASKNKQSPNEPLNQ